MNAHRRSGRAGCAGPVWSRTLGRVSGLMLALLLVWPLLAPGAPAPASAAPGAQAGELIVGVFGDNYRTDPNRSSIGMFPLNANVFDQLVRMSADYQLEPMLATSWEFRAPNTWRFHLRQGVKFHDGTAFTAEAVKWTMLRAARTGTANLRVAEDSTVAVDDYTVDITPSQPNLRLVQQLAHPSWGIVAPDTEPVDRAVGTGPFKVVEYRKADRITVARNDDYWGEKAKLSRITFRFIPDPNTRLLALQAGEVQIVYDVAREAARDIAAVPGQRVMTSPVGAYQALMVNISGKAGYQLGQDRAVRQALALAIDKRTIVQGVWLGNAEESQTMIPAAVLGRYASQIKGVPYDPAQAKAVLDAAGWATGGDGIRVKNGQRLSLEMIVGYPTPEIHKPLPEFVQAQLRDVGIEVRLTTTPDTASYEARLKAGDGDLWLESGNQNDASPCFLLDGLFYTKSNWPGYPALFAPGGAVDNAIEGCRGAVEHEDLQRYAAEAVRLLVEEEFILLPVAGMYRIWAMKDTVQGFVPHPSGVNQRWESVYLSQ